MQKISLNKYYLLRDEKIAIVEEAVDIECPIYGYGAVGCETSDFSHIANLEMDFTEAKEKFGGRCVGVGYQKFSSSQYNFYIDNEEPQLFFVYAESVYNGIKESHWDSFVRGTIKDFEAWILGDVYDVRFFELDSNLSEEDCYLWMGTSNDYDLKNVICEVDKEVGILQELQGVRNSAFERELVIKLIKEKGKRESAKRSQ